MILGTDFCQQSHGDSLILRIKYTEENKITPIDITGCTVLLAIGDIIDQGDTGVVISTPGTDGIIDIVVSDTLMDTLTDTEYLLRVTLVYPDGIKETIYRAVLILIDG